MLDRRSLVCKANAVLAASIVRGGGFGAQLRPCTAALCVCLPARYVVGGGGRQRVTEAPPPLSYGLPCIQLSTAIDVAVGPSKPRRAPCSTCINHCLSTVSRDRFTCIDEPVHRCLLPRTMQSRGQQKLAQDMETFHTK